MRSSLIFHAWCLDAMNPSEGCEALEVRLSYNEKEPEFLNDCVVHDPSPTIHLDCDVREE